MSTENKKENKDDIDLDNIQDEEREFWKEYADFMSIKKYRDAFIYSSFNQDELIKINEFINPQKGQKGLR